MTVDELFEKHSEEFLKFDRVENKRSNRKDLHAFLLLDELFPSKRNMIEASGHDEFYLNISSDQIESLTEERVVELHRCGVRYCSDLDCLCMFA